MKKMISWNVNGLRACVGKGFLDVFHELDADIFCIQESKLQEGQIDLELPGYYQYWSYAEKKGYSGTALFSKEEPLSVSYGLGIEKHDHEGRVITAEYPDYYVVTCYTPNSQNELARLPYRMQWEDDFRQFLKKLEEKKPVIFCGDLNVAHTEIDLKNPKTNRKNAGFTDEERSKFTELLDSGYIDTYRYFYPDKEGVYRVGAVLKDELESAGVETAVIPMERFGNLLTGVWNKEAAGQPIVLIGHMDTVFAKGTLEKNPFRIDENGNAHGPGVLDMKAGLVIVVYVLKALHEYGYGKRPIRVVFAGDEENGHRQTNAESEIRKLCAGCAAAFNFETGFIDDGLVVGRKGSCRVTLTVHGVAAHAGNDPQRGRNAILEMAHKIIEIQKLHDFEHGLFVNVGVIQGGTVANAVAASCEVGIDIRYDSFERLEETLQAIKKIAETRTVPDTTADVTWTKPSTVMPVSEKNLELFRHVQKTADMIGYGKLQTKKVGGWSDSCLAAAEGVPVVCAMGVKGANNHSMEEYAVAETLFSRAKLALASIITF